MILGDGNTAQTLSGSRATLDELFCRVVARRPDALALVDPPDRATFTEGAPRRLTYAEADRIVSAIAGRLQRLALGADAVVGLHLANTVESVLTLLGVLRAGMIAAPLPLLWRRADAMAALGRLSAKLLITTSRVGEVDHCDVATSIAAKIFPIRYVCAFGSDLPDGVIPLDDLMTGENPDGAAPLYREGIPAAHTAVVTWDVTPDGPIPVARNHMELLAGGLAALLEGRIEPEAVILAPCPISSFAGIALTIVPWLLSGGTLLLHQPFNPDVFERQIRDEGCTTVMLPGPAVPSIVQAGLLAHPTLRNVLAIWRTPERTSASPAWTHDSAGLVDVLVFGETGLVAARRDGEGCPAPVPLGAAAAPRGTSGAMIVADLARTERGTLALRGPMVPRYPYPPGVERMPAPYLKATPEGLVDTGYPCRVEDGTVVVTGPPPGVVSIGGYRFLMRELQDIANRAEGGAAIAALPDALNGHRLAGSATDRALAQAALGVWGMNPLLSDAFRDRRKTDAA
jgi:acyl-coenzyme A synthetase/AMP-(fatty) acid ligase